jgi:hypothetical protein
MDWEAAVSTRSVRQLRDATIEELLREVFSVRSVPKCYKQDKSRMYLIVRQAPVNRYEHRSWGIYEIQSRYQATTNEDTADGKGLVRAVVNCIMCELSMAL